MEFEDSAKIKRDGVWRGEKKNCVWKRLPMVQNWHFLPHAIQINTWLAILWSLLMTENDHMDICARHELYNVQAFWLMWCPHDNFSLNISGGNLIEWSIMLFQIPLVF